MQLAASKKDTSILTDGALIDVLPQQPDHAWHGLAADLLLRPDHFQLAGSDEQLRPNILIPVSPQVDALGLARQLLSRQARQSR
jgi:hypothetical protein